VTETILNHAHEAAMGDAVQGDLTSTSIVDLEALPSVRLWQLVKLELAADIHVRPFIHADKMTEMLAVESHNMSGRKQHLRAETIPALFFTMVVPVGFTSNDIAGAERILQVGVAIEIALPIALV
jgi:hypothetical protein